MAAVKHMARIAWARLAEIVRNRLVKVGAPGTAVTVTILNIDPNPSFLGADVTIVYSIRNATSTPYEVAVRIDGRIHRMYVDSHAERVATCVITPSSEGLSAVTAVASIPNGTVVTLHTPDGKTVVEALYTDVAVDRREYFVFGPSDHPPVPQVTDAGPNEIRGTVGHDVCAAGVASRLAGSEELLFLVTDTAGVWRSSFGNAWTQLPQSPRNAFCIDVAVRPGGSLVSIGTTDGESSDPDLDTAGLWESTDDGDTWVHTYDPLPDVGQHRIYALTYSRSSGTLFLGTEGGVARRRWDYIEPISSSFGYPMTARGAAVTAVAVTQSKVFARTADTLLISDDDGETWTRVSMPKQIELDPYGQVDVELDGRGDFGNGNDVLSLGAFDAYAFVCFRPWRGGVGVGDGKFTNLSPVLVYDVSGERWSAFGTNDNDGRGLGGRRFVKSYVLDEGTEAGYGRQLQLFYGSGQGVQQLIDLKNGQPLWSDPLFTGAGGPPHHHGPLHSDIWDFHIPFTYGPPDHLRAWVACDGGVYEGRYPGFAPFALLDPPDPYATGLLPSLQWTKYNDGLHTHNINALTVVSASQNRPALIAYAATDNDAWWRDTNANWQTTTQLGDGMVAFGDPTTPKALIGRNPSISSIVDFQAAPNAVIIAPDASDAVVNFTPTGFQVIPTGAGDPSPSHLDAVMLAQLPPKDAKGLDMPDPRGGEREGPRRAVLRCASLDETQDSAASGYDSWQIVGDRLTTEVSQLWACGPRDSPTYFVIADETDTAPNRLYSFGEQANFREPTERIRNLAPGNGAWSGPVFVNPFDGRQLICAVAGDTVNPGGILKICRDGSNVFYPAQVLTHLLTAGGRYPLGSIWPGSRLWPVGYNYHGTALFNPSAVAFAPGSHAIAVASPFTGIFYASPGVTPDGSIDTIRWQSLAALLPQPLPYVSGLASDIGANDLYAATQGRGLVRIGAPGYAPEAMLFTRVDDTSDPRQLAILRDSVSAPQPWTSVIVSLTRVADTAGRRLSRPLVLLNAEVAMTDATGAVVSPVPLEASYYVVRLGYRGSPTRAPAEHVFRHRVA